MSERERMDSDDPQFVDKVIEQVRQEEAELHRLREFYNEVGAALANENAGGIEHLLAVSSLGKHTTVIGRKRYEQLKAAEAALMREGYRPCDIAACNCGGWHGGHASRRLRELSDAMNEAGCQPMQKTALAALSELIAERDALLEASKQLAAGQ